jgi:putative tryptophan/tyrosine transport system substrate-binding protein
MIDRRAFIATTACILTAPLAAEAQPTGKVYRIAAVHPSQSVADMTEAKDPKFRAFFAELRRLGYVEGQNLVVERRSGEGRPARFPELAREVVQLQPDLIFVLSGRMARAFQAATTTIPTVGITSDPIFEKLVASLARPGGNLTGFSVEADEQNIGKNVEILKEAVPRASRMAFLTPQAEWERPYGLAIRRVGARVGMTVIGALLSEPIQEPEFRRAFAAMVRDRVDTLLVGDNAENVTHRRLIVELAAQARLPAIYPFRDFVDIGGLMSYSVDIVAMFRDAAGYVDRIFKGANPGDLPYQLPTKVPLVINLKTAKALGLTIPPSVLARADEVIQ